MELRFHSHRYGLEVIQSDKEATKIFRQFTRILESISEEDIIIEFQKQKINNGRKDKSISKAVNTLIKQRLLEAGWHGESPIFKESKALASSKDWRLDFVYPDLFSVEIAFNHSSATTINLLKPVIASELNHVEKQFQTRFGIIVTATDALKRAGGFDNAVGTFEGYRLQCLPLMNQLTIPLVIIGLEAPTTFEIIHKKEGNRYIGEVLMKNTGETISLY